MYYEYPYEISEGKNITLLFDIGEMVLIGFVLLLAMWSALILYGSTK